MPEGLTASLIMKDNGMMILQNKRFIKPCNKRGLSFSQFLGTAYDRLVVLQFSGSSVEFSKTQFGQMCKRKILATKVDVHMDAIVNCEYSIFNIHPQSVSCGVKYRWVCH